MEDRLEWTKGKHEGEIKREYDKVKNEEGKEGESKSGYRMNRPT